MRTSKPSQALFISVALLVGFLLGRWSSDDHHSNALIEVTAKPNTSLAESLTRQPSPKRSTASKDDFLGGVSIDFENTPHDIDFSNLPGNQEGMDEIFKKIFRETSQSRRKRLYVALLDNLTAEQAPLLLHSMRLRGGLGVQGHEEYRWLWDRWGELDGETSTALAFKIDGDDGYQSTAVTNIVIKSWTRNHPAEAIAWLAAQKDILLKRGMREGLIEGIMDYHPDAATSLLEQINPTDHERVTAFELMAREVSREKGPEQLDDWFASLPDDTPYRDEIENEVTRIHLAHGVEHAIGWAREHPEQLRETLKHFSTNAPEELFEFFSDQKETFGPEAELALKEAATEWSGDDPNLMGVWLRDHMESPNYDAIARIYIGSIKDVDQDAAQAWINTIRDPRVQADIARDFTTTIP